MQYWKCKLFTDYFAIYSATLMRPKHCYINQFTVANFAMYVFMVFTITFLSWNRDDAQRDSRTHRHTHRGTHTYTQRHTHLEECRITGNDVNLPLLPSIAFQKQWELTLAVPCHKQCIATRAPSCVCAMYTTDSLIDSIISCSANLTHGLYTQWVDKGRSIGFVKRKQHPETIWGRSRQPFLIWVTLFYFNLNHFTSISATQLWI